MTGQLQTSSPELRVFAWRVDCVGSYGSHASPLNVLQSSHKMDKLFELLQRETFNLISYVSAFVWIILGIILFAVFLDIEQNESRLAMDFHCDAIPIQSKDFIRGKCFDQYQEQYSKFSAYIFVIINFLVISIVYVVYSQCVKSRVRRLEDGDPEDQMRK